MSEAGVLGIAGPNAAQIEYWNEISGPKWVALERFIEGQIAPLGERALDAAEPEPGMRVLDVGCGCGQTSLRLAARVGEEGSVLGVDLSGPMLARARERARAAGAANVRFEQVDAQIHPFAPAGFERVFSRFGVMFFADPVAAFTNLARCLAPGGRLTFICWQALADNAWMRVPLSAIAAHVELPPPPDPGAPGPFSLADAGRVRGILASAGFADVRVEALAGKLAVGGEPDLDKVVEFATQMGPAGAVLREAEPELAARAAVAVRAALAPYAAPDGVYMDYAAWIVCARV